MIALPQLLTGCPARGPALSITDCICGLDSPKSPRIKIGLASGVRRWAFSRKEGSTSSGLLPAIYAPLKRWPSTFLWSSTASWYLSS
jgi:hypothetical protein